MMSGPVVNGDKIGRTFGCPTANISLRQSQVPFNPGVYAAHATLDRKVYKAALVIQEKPFKVEVHLFDYVGPEFYGQQLSVEPVQKVSEIEAYDSLEELKEKIHHDLALIRDCLQ